MDQKTILNSINQSMQESAVQQWAESKDVWVPEAEQWLNENYGQMMAMA